MTELSPDALRSAVRDAYGEIALGDAGSCCSPSAVPCCTDGSVSLELGYSPDDLAAVPEGADLGLGCGNPGAIAALQLGETGLDSTITARCLLPGRRSSQPCVPRGL